MKKLYTVFSIAFAATSIMGLSATVSNAVPVLQVGALSTDASQGYYVDYTDAAPDMETAFINGGTLVAAGAYKQNDVVLVGGKYNGGDDWSDMGFDPVFNSHGALLMATVREGWSASDLIGLSGATFVTWFDTFDFPNNHYPVNESDVDYFFFDIGNFSNNPNAVVDLDAETGNADGEIKQLPLSVSGFNWIHFDLLALVTTQSEECSEKVRGVCTSVVTTYDSIVENNPGSHDVTYNDPGNPVPEPATMLLFGTGLIGLAGLARRKSN